MALKVSGLAQPGPLALLLIWHLIVVAYAHVFAAPRASNVVL